MNDGQFDGDASSASQPMNAKSQLAWSALCCCRATEGSDSAEAAEFLTQPLGHCLDEVVKASNGSSILAISVTQRVVFYAFGSDAQEFLAYVNADQQKAVLLNVTQQCFHPVVSGAASFNTNQVSFQGLAQSALAKDYALVICGYRVGGAQAQVTALLLHQHFKTTLGLPSDRISCITFGQPKVVTATLLKTMKDLDVDSLFTTYQLEGDVMPGLLTSVAKKGKGCTEKWLHLCWSINNYLRSTADDADMTDVAQAFQDDIGSCKTDTQYGCLGSVFLLKTNLATDLPKGQRLHDLVLEKVNGIDAFYCGADQLDTIHPRTWYTAISSLDGSGYLDMFAKLWQHGESAAPRLCTALDAAPERGQFELGLRYRDGTRAFKATFWGEGLHWIDLAHGLKAAGLVLTSMPAFDASIQNDSDGTEQDALKFVSSFEVTGTFDHAASQSALNEDTLLLPLCPQFAPSITVYLDLTAAVQGRGQVSNCCPELLIQRALMVVYSDCLRIGIAERPHHALLRLVDDLDRACCNVAETSCDREFENCYSKQVHRACNIRGELCKRLIELDAQSPKQRVADISDAAMAAELDLVNLRGYSVGRIATAIQHMATVLESGLRLVSNDVTYTFEPVNRKYAHQLVQPVCTGGREEAHLPTARGSCTSVDQEDLTVERCRQLIFGTKTAAQAEVKQYKQCLLLLVNLLKENFRMGIGETKRLNVAQLEDIVLEFISKLPHSLGGDLAEAERGVSESIHLLTLPLRYQNKDLTCETVQAIYFQMKAVACMTQLRKAVDRYYMVGVTGLQSGGKSTLTERLIDKTDGNSVAGYNKHTITADVYPLAECSAGSVYLVDTPAVNAPQGTHIAETSLAVGAGITSTLAAGHLNAMIFVTTWNGNPDKNQISAICKLRCHNVPTLVCLNKAGMFEAEHIESRESGETCIDKWNKDIAEKCGAAGIRCNCMPQVCLTEFVSEANDDKGIWGVPQVLKWIKERAAESGYECLKKVHSTEPIR